MRMGSALSWLGLPRGVAIALLLSLACASPVSPQSGSESESENGSESGSEAETEAEDADPLFDDIFDDEFDDRPLGYADPLERTNRGVFASYSSNGRTPESPVHVWL